MKLFSDTILKSKAQTIKILENILREHILESGKKINEKINKRRCTLFTNIRAYDRAGSIEKVS